MREALSDGRLLGEAIPGESWLPWRTLLIASMGEPLVDEEREIFEKLTGRAREPLDPVDEMVAVMGRRTGKTRAAGVLAAYVGCLCDHRGYLVSGERGSFPILAASQLQAGRAFQHARGVIEASPVLSQEIASEPTTDTIRLKTRIDIEVRAASFRTIRGVTAVGAVCDELAYWSIEGSSNPDTEVLAALRPALATTGGPLWMISSPYGKRGELYEAWRRDFGPNGDPTILVAQAPSRVMNSTLPEAVVARAYARDPVVARSEYGAEWRSDIAAFVDRETVEACVVPGLRERPPVEGTLYYAFTDPSGGASDSMTLAIAHRDGDRCVVDALRERKVPFSPEAVVEEFAGLLKDYGVGVVTGDRYAGEWPREAFRRHRVFYELAEQPKSQLFVDCLPVLISARIELLDVDGVVDQFAGLERRVSRNGREQVGHGPHGKDDLVNSISGVVGLVLRRPEPVYGLFGSYTFSGGGGHSLVGTSSWFPTAPHPDELPPPAWLTEPGREEELRQWRARVRARSA